MLNNLRREWAQLLSGDWERAATQTSPFSKGVRFFAQAIRSFVDNRCLIRASALAYTTLLALVPLLAVAISVTTSLLKKQGEKPITEFINAMVARVAPQLDLVSRGDDAATGGGTQEVVSKISHAIGNVRSGTLGATSMVALLFVAISLMRTIESAFNEIWKGTRDRPFLTSLIQYWSAITLGPMLLVVVVGLSTGPHLQATKTLLTKLPMAGQVMTLFLLQCAPFVLMILGLTVFYALMPNTRVRWIAALAGGVVGGILWQLNSLLSIVYVSKVMTYKSLYGSLGTLPVFLLGLYISWVILLFGAQVAYLFQNRSLTLEGKHAEGINVFGREFSAVRIALYSGRRFDSGLAAPSVGDFARELGIPSRLASQVVQVLVHHHVLVEVAGLEPGYAPARSLSHIRLEDLICAIRSGTGQDLATRDDEMQRLLVKELEAVRRAERVVAGSVTLEDLVRKLQETPPLQKGHV